MKLNGRLLKKPRDSSLARGNQATNETITERRDRVWWSIVALVC